MFKTLLKNKKAQNTAEYALLIALVIAGVIAMQTYAQRALQGRTRDLAQFMAVASSDAAESVGVTIDEATQYEPYYAKSNQEVERSSNDSIFLTNSTAGQTMETGSRKFSGSFQESTYNTEMGLLLGP
jgi:Flp pilus assembly pilin Flp